MHSKKLISQSKNRDNDDSSIFLTIDIDWAIDEIILDTLNLLNTSDCAATILITHASPVLKNLQNESRFEIGIHPNIETFHETSKSLSEDFKEKALELMNFVPYAKSYRCHSTTNSSRILEIAKEIGLQYDLNYFIPLQSGIKTEPWKIWNGMTRIPYCWTDDVDLMEASEQIATSGEYLLNFNGLKVFNFHPIHIFLNTKSYAHYLEAKPFQQDIKQISRFKNHGYGIRNIFTHLLNN